MATATKATSTGVFQFDWSGTQIGEYGLPPEAIQDFSGRLVEVRDEFFSDLALCDAQSEIPSAKQPVDMGFFELPERFLAEYEADRNRSELGRILTAARRLRDLVDRVVVLGIGGSYLGARVLFESCCHPYHNELSRGQRGGSPRMYFAGNNVDNDAAAGLLDLLGHGQPTTQIDDAWGIVVVNQSGGTLETATGFRVLLHVLKSSCRGDLGHTAARIIPVTGMESKLHRLTQAMGVKEALPVPDGIGGRFSVFSAVGLVPAAVLGIDVVKLLRGAVSMNEHFRQAPPGNNRALDFMAVNHLMEKLRGTNIRVMSVWSKSLESLGLWYDQLLAEILGKHERCPTRPTVVNTRDLHSRAQQQPTGARDRLFNNVIVETWRQDTLAIGRSEFDQDGLNRIAELTLPEIMTAAISGTNASYRDDHQPTTDIRLPQVDEYYVGQLMQMLMIATTLEGLIAGTSPQRKQVNDFR